MGEQSYPQGVASLVSTVTSLIPRSEKPLTQVDVRDGLSELNCDVGLKLFSSWLDEIGVGGFRQLGLLDKGKVMGAKALFKSQGIQLPSAHLVSDPESQAVLRIFSSVMRRFSQESFGVKAPFGLLLAESIGSQLSSRGSRQLRSALETSLQGHFDWIRNALGVRDVRDPKTEAIVKAASAVTGAVSATVTVNFQDETPAERRARDERLAKRIPESRAPASQKEPVQSVSAPVATQEEAPRLPDYRSLESVRTFFVGERGDHPSRLARIAALKRLIADPSVDATPDDIVEFIDTARDLVNAIRLCPEEVRLSFEPKVPRIALLAQLTKDIEAHEVLHSLLPPR